MKRFFAVVAVFASAFGLRAEETFRYESFHYAVDLRFEARQLFVSRLEQAGRVFTGRLPLNGTFDDVSARRPEGGLLVLRGMRGNGDSATVRFEEERITLQGASFEGDSELLKALADGAGRYDMTKKVPDAAFAVDGKVVTDGKFRVADINRDCTTLDLSYEGRPLGVYRALELKEGVRLPEFVTDFSKVKYVRHELKRFPEREKQSYCLDREMRQPTLDASAPAGLHGRVTAIERLTGANAAGDESKRTWREKAWRGERVNCQAVVWTDRPVEELRLKTSAFESADGARLAASAIRTRFVRYVVTSTNYKSWMNVRTVDDHLVGDILDDAMSYSLPTNGFRPFWLTVDVPTDARPGTYRGTVSAAGIDTPPVDFVLELEVCARTLPRPKDWKFFLDLWQTPWAVARYHQVLPYSDLHFELMKPHLRALADCGQKVITTTMTPVFTEKGQGVPRTMIVDRIWKDGRREFDFTNFDRYVELAKSCGIGPQIHVYSLITFANRPSYVYTDGETGGERELKVRVGDPEYEPHMGPKLAAIERHVTEKGWLADTYIALDELPNDITQEALKILRKYAPHLKTASAGQDVDVDVFSQGLQGDDGFGWGKHAMLPPDYEKKLARRHAEGKITTYYICIFPTRPNAFMDSPLVESRWLGQYASSANFDGLLRWAVHFWNRDPFYDSSFAPYTVSEPGDQHLMYPRALWSTRMEVIRDGIEDFEKIRLLRESGADMTAVDAALKRISTKDVNADDEAATVRKVEGVIRAIEAASAGLVK